MAIEFSCQCGKQIKVSEKFAGRRAKCPGCGEPVVIPSLDAPDDEIDGNLLYEALGDTSGAPEEVKCPKCDRSMPVNAVVCSHCGYNRVARSHVQLTQAANAPKPKRDFSGPVMTLAGIDLTWVRLIVLLIVVIGLPTWYYLGPGGLCCTSRNCRPSTSSGPSTAARHACRSASAPTPAST
ncbi:MAG: zinc ribbon domain-containing protein [Phycisphaerales bacterium]